MIELLNRCGAKPQKGFLMPRGLRYIKTLAGAGIDWKCLHMIDAVSICCSIAVDEAREYLRARTNERMKRAGIRRITPATQADFDSL